MARGARVEYPGALYHVIQRGNNREHIFERHQDKAADLCFFFIFGLRRIVEMKLTGYKLKNVRDVLRNTFW